MTPPAFENLVQNGMLFSWLEYDVQAIPHMTVSLPSVKPAAAAADNAWRCYPLRISVRWHASPNTADKSHEFVRSLLECMEVCKRHQHKSVLLCCQHDTANF